MIRDLPLKSAPRRVNRREHLPGLRADPQRGEAATKIRSHAKLAQGKNVSNLGVLGAVARVNRRLRELLASKNLRKLRNS